MRFQFIGTGDAVFPEFSAHVTNPLKPGDVFELPEELDPHHPHVQAVDVDVEVTNSRDLESEQVEEDEKFQEAKSKAKRRRFGRPDKDEAPDGGQGEEDSTEADGGGDVANQDQE